VIVRSLAQRPVEESLRVLNCQIIDAGVSVVHQAVRTELPILVAVRTEPLSRRIVGLICEADGDAIAIKGP
jgi:hypothetical protein